MAINVIETIGTLSELKAYCCPKVVHEKEWYLRCVDCKGLKDCTAGRRAVELLNSQTRPQVSHNNHAWEYNERKKNECRNVYEQALKSGNAHKFLMDKYNLSNKSASQKLYNWKKKYEDITSKYSSDGMRKAKDRIDEVFASADPIGYMIEHQGLSYIKARSTLSRWSLTYPDMEEKYHIREYMAKTVGMGDKYKNVTPVKVKKPEDDELSVEEFLKEQEEPNDIKAPAEKLNIIPEEVAPKETPVNDILLSAIKQKQNEIRSKISDLENEIKVLETRIGTLNSTYYILTGTVAPD